MGPAIAAITLVACSNGDSGSVTASRTEGRTQGAAATAAAPNSSGAGCQTSALATITLGTGATVTAHGTGPFYFGPFGKPLVVSDFNKVPWEVSPSYTGPLVVRGAETHTHAVVTFGFFPTGLGTPSQEPGVPVVARRQDDGGHEIVYQAELDIAPGPPGGWRNNGHAWSFPQAGCYTIEADGNGLAEVTVIEVSEATPG